ncbi:hypothetical protein HUU62_06120 [Rhodoferax sp. 4810]|nr:hypothetical protein [Rhodoferax jenense]
MTLSYFGWTLLLLALSTAPLTQAQTAPAPLAPAPGLQAMVAVPTSSETASAEPAAALKPLDVVEIQASPQAPATVAQGCRPLTDQAMTADFNAVTAQAAKAELAQQVKLLEQAVALWTQAAGQCDGRAKERALRSLDDNSRMLARISEKMDSGPQCTAAHKDATSLQDIARQALSERRWLESAALFRKAENMWDLAAERCTGSQQTTATERRTQTEVDGHNAEFCAPLFESAREATQKLRAAANALTREQKQNDSQVAETLWRQAMNTCKGAAVRDLANNNAASLARQRGTPWVATAAPQAEGAVAQATLPAPATLGSAAPAAVVATSPATATAPTQVVPSPASPPTPAPAGTQMAGSTQFVGNFVRDADALTYSGSGRVVWATGDVFDGTLVQGLRQGKGVITWVNGHRYDGDWLNDLPTGTARVHFANGNDYEGSVLNGVPQGQGRIRYVSGDTFEGQFKAGEPDQKGLYVWKNGQSYDGQWQNARPNGQGKLKFATGNQYEGSVVNGMPNGAGRMVFATGEIYTGQFVNGEPDGEGAFVWPSGDQYTGQWKAGKKHGKGVLTWKSGDRWEGIFDNDVQTAADTVANKG